MNKSEVIIYWSDEDETFMAEAPESAPLTAPEADCLLRTGERGWIDTTNAR